MLHTFDIAHSVGSEDVCKRCFLLLAPAALGRGPLRPQRLPRVFVLHSPLGPSISVFVFAERGDLFRFCGQSWTLLFWSSPEPCR